MEIVSNYKNGKYETRTLIDKPYKYTKYENNNFYYFVYTISNTRGVEHADTLTIPKTSLLEFGIGPGLYENLGVSSDYFSCSQRVCPPVSLNPYFCNKHISNYESSFNEQHSEKGKRHKHQPCGV